MALMRAHCSRNCAGLTLLVIQPSACRATRRKLRSTTEASALAPPFQVNPVGLLAIQIGCGCWTGGGSTLTASNW
jgi:hypothetical protein